MYCQFGLLYFKYQINFVYWSKILSVISNIYNSESLKSAKLFTNVKKLLFRNNIDFLCLKYKLDYFLLLYLNLY